MHIGIAIAEPVPACPSEVLSVFLSSPHASTQAGMASKHPLAYSRLQVSLESQWNLTSPKAIRQVSPSKEMWIADQLASHTFELLYS